MASNTLLYPSLWRQLLNPFASCFTKPQFGNFCQSTTAIAVSNHTSICRLAHLFEPKHQSSLNDFFSLSPWDDALVQTRLTRITFRHIRDGRVGIIDDTLSHKPYAKKMAHVNWYYDGKTKQRQKGNSIVTHGIQSQQLGFVPVDVRLYKEDGITKNDIACTMIHRTHRYSPVPLYAVDSWYSNSQVLGCIRNHKSHFVTEIKSNRKVTLSRKERFIREHEQHITKWKEGIIHKGKYRFFQTSGFIHGIGNVNIVFSQRYEGEKKEWGETYYLITDVLSLSGERVIGLYLLRGGIEGFHRESKQQLGFEGYHLRSSRGIERYLFLVMLVYVLLLLLCQFLMKDTFEKKSIGQLCEHLKAACYTSLLQNAKSMKEKDLKRTAEVLAYSL